MDKRPILRVIAGGRLLSRVRPAVCRSLGCADDAVSLGFCERCRSRYARRTSTNRDRYAVLAEQAAARLDFGVTDPFVHALLVEEHLNALASDGYPDGEVLTTGGAS